MVINYDRESYIVRSGKFGRKVRSFAVLSNFEQLIVINFVIDEEMNTLRDIELFYNTTINECPMNVNHIHVSMYR